MDLKRCFAHTIRFPLNPQANFFRAGAFEENRIATRRRHSLICFALDMKIPCTLALLLALTPLPCLVAADAPPRPHITGLSHMALYVHDLEKSRAFYKNFLGFAEPYSLTNQDGTIHLTWIKINDHQSIELFPETEAGSDRLNHIALETDDAEALRLYLAAHGIAVPDKTAQGKIGNKNYTVKDPDGHIVEIVQYEPGGWTMLNQGKFMPDTRLSDHIPHLGILVGDLAASQKFYGDLLGFKEIWRGARATNQLNWVHEQVPDGKDFIELMLYSELPAPDQRGTAHHFCLETPDLEKTRAVLAERAAKMNYTRPLQIQTGINRKRQLNVYDPDGTRVEFMEPRTIDGVPTPSSMAPPPHPPTPKS
jgi:catechol 2,3-dioxygenase-like lactoylglutathione lyase family enzyme